MKWTPIEPVIKATKEKSKQLYKVVYHEWEDFGHYRKRNHQVIAVNLSFDLAQETAKRWRKSYLYNWHRGDRITVSKIRRRKYLCIKRNRTNGML